MQPIRTLLLAMLVLGGVSCRQPDEPVEDPTDAIPDGELKAPARDAAPVAATRRMAGIYRAGSRINDPDAFGGFGACNNYPKNLDDKEWGTTGEISLVAFPDEPVAYLDHRGIALRLINRSGEVAAFHACDSCLFLVQEAVGRWGRWREIEVFITSGCGNSFHRVFLRPNQYWEFPARRYTGPIKTKVRFRLDRTGWKSPIYSNEFDGSVESVQFK